MTEVSFKQFDVVITSLGSAPDTPASIIVCWELVVQHSGLPETTFQIERCLSNGFDPAETEVIAEGIQGVANQLVYSYRDITINLISLWRRYFYRVRATVGGRNFVSRVKTWETDPRPWERGIIADHDFYLRKFAGQPSFAFSVRTTDAPYCPSCWDFSSSRVRISGCTLCLGTGRQRPYFEPIPFYVDFNPDQKIVQMTPFGENETHAKVCWFSAYPSLKPADIIYQIMPGLLWRIDRINLVAPMGTTIQQMASLGVIDQTNVEYKRLLAQIPEAQLLEIVREWERLKREMNY